MVGVHNQESVSVIMDTLELTVLKDQVVQLLVPLVLLHP